MLTDHFFDLDHNLLNFTQNALDQRSNSSSPSPMGVPVDYPYLRLVHRAPVVQIGYITTKPGNVYFLGSLENNRPNFYGIQRFLKYWDSVRDDIDIPFIAFQAWDINIGALSSGFPMRTKEWGPYYQEKLLRSFLDHNKTVMLLVNQHSNITHPKIITIPLGIPTADFDGNSHRRFWDHMRLYSRWRKTHLGFTASSDWKYRSGIMNCISRKFSKEDLFDTVIFTSGKKMAGRMTGDTYHKRLAMARFTVALPGLGYDTFRLWEALTFGTIPIVEKGVGLDKVVSGI